LISACAIALVNTDSQLLSSGVAVSSLCLPALFDRVSKLGSMAIGALSSQHAHSPSLVDEVHGHLTKSFKIHNYGFSATDTDAGSRAGTTTSCSEGWPLSVCARSAGLQAIPRRALVCARRGACTVAL